MGESGPLIGNNNGIESLRLKLQVPIPAVVVRDGHAVLKVSWFYSVESGP